MCTLGDVADLAEVAEQQILETSAQELTGDWHGYHVRNPATSVTQPTGQAPTQQLAGALFALRNLQGFQSVSARLPEHRILIVFPEKLRGTGSRLTFYNPVTGQTQSIP